MATTTKKSAKKKSAPGRAAKKTTKNTGKRPRKLFTEEELEFNVELRPSNFFDVGATLTDKVISVLEDAVGTPPVVP